MEKDLYVANTENTGRGLFINKNIKKGQNVFIMRGRIIKCNMKTKCDAMKLPDIVGVGKNTWIDPRPPFKYINHSCNPNVGTKGTVTFVALRDIRKDEEITFDYSISEDSLWEMKCACGHKNCRGIIKGIKYLPLETFNRYLPYIPLYFQRVYKRYKKQELMKKAVVVDRKESHLDFLEKIFVN